MSAEAAIPTRVSSAGSRPSWRLAAIVMFLGAPLAAAALAGSAILTGLDASAVADHAETTSRAIIHQLDHRPVTTQAPVDTSALYLASANASLARAELQALASRMVEAGGGRVIEMQSVDASEPDPANHVSVDVTYDVNNRGLLDILFAAETGLPLLTAPKLDIREEATSDAMGQTNGMLRVTMTLQGTWRPATP